MNTKQTNNTSYVTIQSYNNPKVPNEYIQKQRSDKDKYFVSPGKEGNYNLCKYVK